MDTKVILAYPCPERAPFDIPVVPDINFDELRYPEPPPPQYTQAPPPPAPTY